MKQVNRFALTLLLVTTTLFGFAAQSAAAAEAGRLSGTVWLDANENGIQEFTEEPLAQASVTVTNVDTGIVVMVDTDDSGNFVVWDLAYGLYAVEAAGNSGESVGAQLVEVGEVMGVQAVALPAYPAASFSLFLPVTNG